MQSGLESNQMAFLNQKTLAEAEADASSANRELIEAKWGFLKNIVNIESFFSFGGTGGDASKADGEESSSAASAKPASSKSYKKPIDGVVIKDNKQYNDVS